MLGEWITYLTTPCPRHVRDMGYLRDLIGVEARYRRCRQAWAGHLENTRAAILESAAACRGRRRAVVLGSGPLYDVPLGELSARFEEVVLVDIVHLRHPRRPPNVRSESRDLSGVARDLHAWVGRRRDGFPPVPRADLPVAGADLVVSCNLLSQLPQLPLEYAGRDGEGAEAFARALIANHLEALGRCEGTVCLITDTERLIHDGERVIDREDSLHGVVLPASRREWTWDIAPPPEVDRRYGQRLTIRVVG